MCLIFSFIQIRYDTGGAGKGWTLPRNCPSAWERVRRSTSEYGPPVAHLSPTVLLDPSGATRSLIALRMHILHRNHATGSGSSPNLHLWTCWRSQLLVRENSC